MQAKSLLNHTIISALQFCHTSTMDDQIRRQTFPIAAGSWGAKVVRKIFFFASQKKFENILKRKTVAQSTHPFKCKACTPTTINFLWLKTTFSVSGFGRHSRRQRIKFNCWSYQSKSLLCIRPENSSRRSFVWRVFVRNRCTQMIQAVDVLFLRLLGSGREGGHKERENGDKKSVACQVGSFFSSQIEIAWRSAHVFASLFLSWLQNIWHTSDGIFCAQSCKRLWNAMKIILARCLFMSCDGRKMLNFVNDRDINFHIDEQLLHGAVTRVCYFVHLSKQFDTMEVETLNANQWRDLYTPSKATESQLWCIKHAEKATRHCFKAKCVSSELSNYCRVCFRCVNFKTNFKDSFSRALTQISCFFASSWSQRRVSMNRCQPTHPAMITLFHLSALRHLSREKFTAVAVLLFIYI